MVEKLALSKSTIMPLKPFPNTPYSLWLFESFSSFGSKITMCNLRVIIVILVLHYLSLQKTPFTSDYRVALLNDIL